MRRRNHLLLFAFLLLGQVGLADTATTRVPSAASTPATQSRVQIEDMYQHLSDPDPRIREQAKVGLMGISLSQLNELQQVVAGAPPFSPQVTGALHEIVTQAFLAHDKYTDLDGNEVDSTGASSYYFLGVLWPLGIDDDPRLGAFVDERLLGFPSYRYFHAGDLIMGVIFDTTEALEVPPNVEIQRPADLKAALQHKTRSTVIFQLIRDGEIIQVPMQMAPRPAQAGLPDPPLNGGPVVDYADQIKTFNHDRVVHAEEFWHDKFDSIIAPAAAE